MYKLSAWIIYIKMNPLLVFLGLSILWSCTKTGELSPFQQKSLFQVPSNFNEPVYNMAKNPITNEGFQLGRKLFYDGRLSKDGTISCAECHSQPSAFTHHGHVLSHGINDAVGTRNAPPIQNTAWMKSFFWDGGVFDLDLFSIAPITNPVEMDETLDNVLQKIEADKEYRTMFKKAYGSEVINTERFLKALSQFMNALVSSNSKYDKHIRNEQGGAFTPLESTGLRVFEQKCATCHSGPLFSDGSFRNNGLEPHRRDPDKGRALISGLDVDLYKFKVPSLRNIGFTGPYMHDGRYSTLEEVLDHYTDNMVVLETLDPIFLQGEKPGLSLNANEKKELKAFLLTLNDEEFIKDPRYAAP